ncbi:MAG: rRNA maturation RNase YbeY [Bacteroidia bacterium]|nr:rRNA maturation RNase YbeY [Bacteroidia bacterium]
MISFNYQEADLVLDEDKHLLWLKRAVLEEGQIINEIAYILTTDEEVLALNKKFLRHDYYTDILTFDRSENQRLSGDIFISQERVEENAATHEVEKGEELRRVMIHGLLHMMGYKDDSEEDRRIMREREDYYLKMFHVEQ